jgi:hypothetical protein
MLLPLVFADALTIDIENGWPVPDDDQFVL